jgi:ring-1,2-phenylacetyl-CoA epoxidase subunit PaaC
MMIENPDLRQTLADHLLALADDEFILGQRDAEWCGHAPILEEDIAFANIALDEIGHAGLWYGVLAALQGEDSDTYPDQLVYRRDPEGFCNAQFVELPRGDWAFTILRQYLFDELEVCRLGRQVKSEYRPIAEVAEKVQKEEAYHLRHTLAWVRRLGLGTDESRVRMQNALDSIWGYCGQLFQLGPSEKVLIESGYLPASHELEREWREKVESTLQESGLHIPTIHAAPPPSRSEHTGGHRTLILELQSVVRQHPEASW